MVLVFGAVNVLQRYVGNIDGFFLGILEVFLRVVGLDVLYVKQSPLFKAWVSLQYTSRFDLFRFDGSGRGGAWE
jgi:hypothetical protein